MSWVTPPTFTTGAVLTATQLNTLSDDLEYLHGFVSGANPAITAVQLAADGDAYALIRHMHRYLWVQYAANDDVRIYYDATEVYHDGAPAGTREGHVIDLDSFGLTVGQLYTIKLSLDSDSGGVRIVYYLFESDVAS